MARRVPAAPLESKPIKDLEKKCAQNCGQESHRLGWIKLFLIEAKIISFEMQNR